MPSTLVALTGIKAGPLRRITSIDILCHSKYDSLIHQSGESSDLSLIGVSVRRLYGLAAALFGVVLVVGGCTSTETAPTVSSSSTSSIAAKGDQRTSGWDAAGKPVHGGPAGADGSTGNNLSRDYCAHNQSPKCPKGS